MSSSRSLLPVHTNEAPKSEPVPHPSLWHIASPKAADDIHVKLSLSNPLPPPVPRQGTDASLDLDLYVDSDGDGTNTEPPTQPPSFAPGSAGGEDGEEPATGREMIFNFFNRVKLDALRRVVLFGDQDAQEDACNEFKDLEGLLDGDLKLGEEGGDDDGKRKKKDRKEKKGSKKDRKSKRSKSSKKLKNGLLGPDDDEEQGVANTWWETFKLAVDLQMGLCVLWCAAMVIVWAFGLLVLELSIISCFFFFMGIWLAGDGGKERRRRRRKKKLYGSDGEDYEPPKPGESESDIVKAGRRDSQHNPLPMAARLGSSGSTRGGISRRSSAASQNGTEL
mmetsp:Transcript_30276/g.74409  ORF Transcript_30276/g.74409 Transcript_30276/m.74409 type:complete len:335 (+) Transcript_30276:135-1139(+)